MTRTREWAGQSSVNHLRRALCAGAVLIGICALSHHAFAADVPSSLAPVAPVQVQDLQMQIQRQETELAAAAAELKRTEVKLAVQQALIEGERRQIASFVAEAKPDLAVATARGESQPQLLASADQPPPSTKNDTIATTPDEPTTPVGEAPPLKPISASVLPQGVNVLTAPGHFVFESAAAYVQSSNNLLVFRGIELVPGVEVGAIDANDTSRNQLAVWETLRFGLGPRWEIEAVVPYIYGTDRVTEAVQRDQEVTETTLLRGSGLGDIEFTGRYQITDGSDGGPLLVANLRVKPPSGRGPFDLKYDQFGAALNLPTGSGFWGVEPSLSMLYTTDPVVIFGSLGYLYNVPTDVDKMIGGAFVGPVRPGGSVDLSFGFAFALNQQFSFSLGFKDNYIFDTYTKLNGIEQRSFSLQTGSLLFGTSYRLTDHLSIASNFEFGVTSDAPDLTLTIRLPYAF